MNLLTTYSHYCGVKPKEASIDEMFYAIPFDKYIVVHAGTGMPTKTYDNFDEVLPHLKLPTVQVGGPNDTQLPVSLDLRGKTAWNHTAYLIHHAKLFLGCDSICAHMAAHFATPSVVLWGATLPSTCATNWNQDKVIHLNPLNRYGCATACHASECLRGTKCVNSITPALVIDKIASVLGKDAVEFVDVIHIGTLAKLGVLEWLPSALTQNVFNLFTQIRGLVSVRTDLVKTDLNILSQFCNAVPNTVKFVLIVNPSEDLKKLTVNHAVIEQLVIMVDKTNIVEGIQWMKELAKKMYKVRLMSKEDHTVFNDYKTDMLDFPPITRLQDFEYNDKHKEMFLGKTYSIKSNRKIIAGEGKLYITMHDALNEKNSVENIVQSANICIEEPHLKELQYLTITKYI